MNNQEPTPTFEWLDDNLEPYCPGRPTCQEECCACPVHINEEAFLLFDEGKLEEAKEQFKKAIDLTPDWKYGAAWCNLGTVYNHLGWGSDAFESFKNAWCINPDNPRAYEGLAGSYASFNEYDKALQWCDKYAMKFGEEGIAKLRGKILAKMAGRN
jgi:tetratricopeptide (TPR) repeat protein